MSKIEARGAEATDSSDWNHAWSLVAQLAAARGAALSELGQGGAVRPAASAGSEHAPRDGTKQDIDIDIDLDLDPDLNRRGLADPRRAHAELVDSMQNANVAAKAAAPPATVAPDQLARDMAEIEQAAAALRRAEPALERQVASPPAAAEPRSQHSAQSVWYLVGVIWLTAVAVVSCAAGTVALLLG